MGGGLAALAVTSRSPWDRPPATRQNIRSPSLSLSAEIWPLLLFWGEISSLAAICIALHFTTAMVQPRGGLFSGNLERRLAWGTRFWDTLCSLEESNGVLRDGFCWHWEGSLLGLGGLSAWVCPFFAYVSPRSSLDQGLLGPRLITGGKWDSTDQYHGFAY